MTASLPLPGLPTLDAPPPPSARIPHSPRGQARIAAAGARSDLAALVKGDRVTVCLGERPVGIRVVRGLVMGGKRVSVDDPKHPGCADHYSATSGLRFGGRENVRPYRERDEERIHAWDDVAQAEAADALFLAAAKRAEDRLLEARGVVENFERALPAARHEARIAAAALSDARARLARIDEEGGA